MREATSEELLERIEKLERKLKTAVSMLKSNIYHDEDCADQDEHFEEYEECECGASSIQHFVKEIEEFGVE